MQPSNPQHPRGSFTKPEPPKQVKPQITPAEEIKENLQPEENVNEAIAQAADDVLAKPPTLEEKANKLKEWIEEISEELQVKLNDEDIRNYILKGRMSKEIALVPGLMRGTLQTLRIEDLQNIDARMASIRDSSKFTVKGIENEEAIIALAHAWTHADGKPLGDSPASREEKIRKMGSLFVERASNARVNFDALVRFVMQERGLIKK